MDDVKQTLQSVQDIRRGLKKESVRLQKQAGYKRQKYTNAMKAGDHTEALAAVFGNAFCRILDDAASRAKVNGETGIEIMGGRHRFQRQVHEQDHQSQDELHLV